MSPRHAIASRPWRAGALALTMLGLLGGGGRIAAEAVEVRERWAHLHGLRTQASSLDAWERERTALDERADSLRRAFDLLSARTPAGSETAAALLGVYEQAEAMGVRVLRVEPGARLEHEAHALLPLSVELEGRFHAVFGLVDALERSALRLRVTHVRARRQDGEGPALHTTLSLHALTLRQTTEVTR